MRFLAAFLIGLFVLPTVVLAEPIQASCNVYKHGNEIVKFHSMELTINGKAIPMTSIGSDLPYRVDNKANPKYTVEPVAVHDMSSDERFGQMWAILINDVLYRPDCK